jgi:hypothetical protein
MVMENVFGILSSVFRERKKPILLDANKAQIITLACVYLHNFLRRNAAARSTCIPTGTFDSTDMGTGNVIEGSRRQDKDYVTSLHPLRRTARKPATTVKCNSDEFAYLFSAPQGQVHLQNKYA